MANFISSNDFKLGGSESNNATLSIEKLDNSSVPFNDYVRLKAPVAAEHAWNIKLSANPVVDLSTDDIAIVSFFMRGNALGEETETKAKVIVKSNSNETKLMSMDVSSLNNQWRQFSSKLDVAEAIGSGKYTLIIHAGFGSQKLEIGGVEIKNYGPVGHRLSALSVTVQDKNGNPLPEATLDVQMTKHGFKFGTQVRDRLYTITKEEFDAASDVELKAMLPAKNDKFDMTGEYVPTWKDVINYRNAIKDTFNHIFPTKGIQWSMLEKNSAIQDAAVRRAWADGQSVAAGSVVWQKKGWPTPKKYEFDSKPDAHEFHKALIEDRLGPKSVLQQYSKNGTSPNIDDWKTVNEPLHEEYYWRYFKEAGIYKNKEEAIADYFKRARATRPDVVLSINDYNIINNNNDDFAIKYRDLVQKLLDEGAPVDRIGVQAHMNKNITRQDMIRRLDILAETGLPIAITEYDCRCDHNCKINATKQERLFRDMLETSFQHKSVEKFIIWGVWDPAHWRGNAPLFDAEWNVKPQAKPWFDLVHNLWKPNLVKLAVNESGEWNAPIGLFKGDYKIVAKAKGVQTVSNVTVSDDVCHVITVDC